MRSTRTSERGAAKRARSCRRRPAGEDGCLLLQPHLSKNSCTSPTPSSGAASPCQRRQRARGIGGCQAVTRAKAWAPPLTAGTRGRERINPGEQPGGGGREERRAPCERNDDARHVVQDVSCGVCARDPSPMAANVSVVRDCVIRVCDVSRGRTPCRVCGRPRVSTLRLCLWPHWRE